MKGKKRSKPQSNGNAANELTNVARTSKKLKLSPKPPKEILKKSKKLSKETKGNVNASKNLKPMPDPPKVVPKNSRKRLEETENDVSTSKKLKSSLRPPKGILKKPEEKKSEEPKVSVINENESRKRFINDEIEDEPVNKKKKVNNMKSKGMKGFPMKTKGKKPFSKSPALNGSEGKPNWNELKEQKKILRAKRRAAQKNADSFEVSIEAKKIVENIRQKKCSDGEKIKQMTKVHTMLKGKLLSVVYAHDMSRVVEVMLKLANEHKQTNISQDMVNELMPEILDMSKKKYAVHVVRAIIANSSAVQRHLLVEKFRGHVLKMLNHSVGNAVLEQLYAKIKPEEKFILNKELYGPSYKLITNVAVTGLNVIFKELPHMKESVLANTKEILNSLFEKSIVESHIMHTVLLDYLSCSAPADSTAMLELARNHVKALTSSKDGVHVAVMCVWMGTPKARKKLIKDLKESFVSLACGEHSHLLLLSIFDSMDDTVLVNKIILSELLSGDLTPLLQSTYGRKTLMYLCSWRDPSLFSGAVVAMLAAGDSNPHSKKDKSVRALELRGFAVVPLLKHIADNTSIWMENNPNLLVLNAVLKAGFGVELQTAIKAVSRYVVNPPNSPEGSADISVAERAGCHMMLKKLAEHDKVLAEKNEGTFGQVLIEELKDFHYRTWLANNRCCFLFLSVLQNGTPEVTEELKSKIVKLAPSIWKKKDSIPSGGQKIWFENFKMDWPQKK